MIAADDVSKLLKEIGVAADKEELDAMLKALSGKKLHDLVREGSSKLATVAVAGGNSFASLNPFRRFRCPSFRWPRCCCQAQGRRKEKGRGG